MSDNEMDGGLPPQILKLFLLARQQELPAAVIEPVRNWKHYLGLPVWSVHQAACICSNVEPSRRGRAECEAQVLYAQAESPQGFRYEHLKAVIKVRRKKGGNARADADGMPRIEHDGEQWYGYAEINPADAVRYFVGCGYDVPKEAADLASRSRIRETADERRVRFYKEVEAEKKLNRRGAMERVRQREIASGRSMNESLAYRVYNAGKALVLGTAGGGRDRAPKSYDFNSQLGGKSSTSRKAART